MKGSSFETGWRFVTKRKGPSCLPKSVSFWCMQGEVQQVFSIGYSSKMTCLGNGWMGIQLGLKIVFLSGPTLLSMRKDIGKSWKSMNVFNPWLAVVILKVVYFHLHFDFDQYGYVLYTVGWNNHRQDLRDSIPCSFHSFPKPQKERFLFGCGFLCWIGQHGHFLAWSENLSKVSDKWTSQGRYFVILNWLKISEYIQI